MNVAAADSVSDVRLNDQSLGLTATGFTAFTPLTISRGFVPGTNTLDVVVTNGPSLVRKSSGLRVTFSSTAPVPVTADWIGHTLLIDVENTSRQKTTRLAEATEMMQSLFFGLRNGAFDQLWPSPAISSWSLNEAHGLFDDEWYWMGSYSNWQSIMRVFLYPENLLLPSFRVDAAAANGEPALIAEKTAAFKTLGSTLDSNAPLKPGMKVGDDLYQALATYMSNLTQAPYNNDLPADLKSQLKYPDPRNVNFATLQYPDPSSGNMLSWGPVPSDWNTSKALPFLWEAWYFVPIQVALELQKAGQFEAALDWFRLVYRYDLPLIEGSDDARKIFYGLRIETAQSTQFTYAQIPTWLIDSANPHQIAPTRLYPYTRSTIFLVVQCLLDFADAQFGTETAESMANARLLYLQAQDLLDQMQEVLPADSVTEANPVLAAMGQHAETSLFNLRSGRNIAGMLIPAQAPSDSGISIQTSAYRYSALIERAKQLVTLAQQVEATYLTSLTAADNEAYTALKANQDLETATATVTLQQLQLQTATDGITLANDQVAKANGAADHYKILIGSDIISLEQRSIASQQQAVTLQQAAAVVSAAGSADFFAAIETLGQSVFGGASSALSSLAAAAGTTGSILNAQASLEEKQSDWQFGRSQAQVDVTIGNQQVVIATDQQNTAVQQLNIANLQTTHAQATVNFLANKFTNADLYRWMSGVLGGVYAYFLRQAAAMARLAENQLAFERQQKALSVIRPDYWQPLSSAGLGSQGNRGLTGAETLLEDITTVDQYAFATDQIKLQITKTISLALLDPFAFQQFTKTGVLRFSTPTDVFGRDFPGHYLRLISQVRASVVALVPPSLGINATLANSGISRVVLQNGTGNFDAVVVQRDPQLIALSSPNNSTGLFPLTTSSQSTLLLPFEDLGVDTSWEFTMPKAANPFDYSTIADVQISIDYTALDSPDYRLQIIQQLDRSMSADRAYSFAQQFPDAWYELNNASQYPTRFTVQFPSQASDFPPNVENLSIAQLLMYFIPADGAAFQLQPTLDFTPYGASTPVGGAAGAPTDPNAPPVYVFSTRRGNASAWVPIIGLGVSGNWTLSLPNTTATANIFQNQQIRDILFVITYSGNTPAWPT
jgi:hypothetical protein